VPRPLEAGRGTQARPGPLQAAGTLVWTTRFAHRSTEAQPYFVALSTLNPLIHTVPVCCPTSNLILFTSARSLARKE